MTKIQKDNKNVAKFPNLRFPEFTEEWETKKLGEIGEIVNGLTYSPNDIAENGVLVLRSSNVQNRSLAFEDNVYVRTDNYNPVQENDILICVRNGSKNLIGKNALINKENEGVAFGAFMSIYRSSFNTFLFHWFDTNEYKEIVYKNLGATINSINGSDLRKFKVPFPSIEEQKKLASFLSIVDERIQTQNKIIEELKLLKITLRYQLYEQILNHENEYVQVKDALNYEQPTKYLVTNTDYSSDISLIPVLTANKAFVLGYTDEEFGIYDKGQCIIFDDFTMDIKFVNFPFKVKSSAIKILTAKPNVNLKFIFEYLLFLNLSSNEHKRHYISEIETMEMQLPNYIQQTYVADFLASIDNKIKNEFEIHTLLLKQKQYLLANLFI
ncbi:restriction endonuclease subunit S [Elizabethkingia anophelis]|uniref:restriction endonuclease subunit S n=1 Tax=Elizabethkingia anophelis TaxID=1117645 RepID=UPI00248DC8A9|nr:restriction endonuclease subunit S [Elizabethkingia anophelis]EJC8059399.1 restriction endonuclease subunit S [Elizabethkingia anophelis]WBS72819.1 restriction endonuclease subunit S [Elizabethkingia anophelis]